MHAYRVYVYRDIFDYEFLHPWIHMAGTVAICLVESHLKHHQTDRMCVAWYANSVLSIWQELFVVIFLLLLLLLLLWHLVVATTTTTTYGNNKNDDCIG